MRMDWNWPGFLPPLPSKADPEIAQYEFNWPIGSFGLRYRPLRKWHWHRIGFWFVTFPGSILFLAWELGLL